MKQILMPEDEFNKELQSRENFGKQRGLDLALSIVNPRLTNDDVDDVIFNDDYLRLNMKGNPTLSLKSIGKHYRELIKTKEKKTL